MDKKLAKVLYTINQNTNMTKLDIKNKTGFSMTTVLSCVKRLQDYGLITCGARKVKGGKAPSIINASFAAYVVGMGYSNGYLRATRADLNGNVEFVSEKRTEETKEHYDEMFAEIKKAYPPVAVGVISEKSDYKYVPDCVTKTQRSSGDICEGLSSFYRFFSLKNNSETVVVYIDDEIILLRSDENEEHLNVNDLHSPILHSEKGRLTYKEVLSKKEVTKRLYEKYQATLEDLALDDDEEIVAYRSRINLAFRELTATVDRLLNPKSIVIGGYLPQAALKLSPSDTRCPVFFAGDTSTAVGHLASAIALNGLYYYD